MADANSDRVPAGGEGRRHSGNDDAATPWVIRARVVVNSGPSLRRIRRFSFTRLSQTLQHGFVA